MYQLPAFFRSYPSTPIAFVLLLVTTSCASAPETPALYEESIDPDENMEFTKMVGELRTIQERQVPAHRGFHTKVHGCVSGSIEMLSSRPAWSREGIFADEKQHPFVMRFTNGAPSPKPDREGDMRGVGLKIFGVPGEKLLATQSEATTQDFVLNNSPIHFTSDPREFTDFIVTLDGSSGAFAWFMLTHPSMARPVIAITGRDVPTLTQESFYSISAFKLGSRAVKYKLQPCTPSPDATNDDTSPNYLHTDLAHFVADQDMCWILSMQLQIDSTTTPIEDVTVEWPEHLAPAVKVAKLHVPRQNLEDPEVEAACDKLVFTPWHSLAEHRPLGKFNRVRRPVYAASQKTFRHGAVPSEPSSFPVKLIKTP